MTDFYPINPYSDDMPARCQNCAKVYPVRDLAPIADAEERLEIGGEIPAGECPDPECGALCMMVKAPRRIAVIVEGGAVQAIVADYPQEIASPVLVIDYDTDGRNPDELFAVQMATGETEEAGGGFLDATAGSIMLPATFDSAQERDIRLQSMSAPDYHMIAAWLEETYAERARALDNGECDNPAEQARTLADIQAEIRRLRAQAERADREPKA